LLDLLVLLGGHVAAQMGRKGSKQQKGKKGLGEWMEKMEKGIGPKKVG